MGLFDEDVRRIKRIVNQVLEDLALEAVKQVVYYSPVWSGEYVSSVTVEIGPHPKQYARFESPRVSPKISEANVQVLKAGVLEDASLKIKTLAPKNKRLHIGNSAPHALIVEMTDAPYEMAAQITEAKASMIANQAEAKVKK